MLCTPARMVSPYALQIERLQTRFRTGGGEVCAVHDVSLSLRRGSVLALVGESGCGKTVTAYSILRLIRPPGRVASGHIRYFPADGGETLDLAALPSGDERLYQVRGGRIGMIFQEPMTALSPVHTVGDQVGEVLTQHRGLTRAAARAEVVTMLRKVGLPAPERRLNQYPHELSGGMRQRVMIAMALIGRPEILIADEPTTALDVTLQAQILKLIKTLCAETGTSVLFITHDLGVVAQVADDVAVMYLGRVVEQGTVRQVLKTPRHPYTAALLRSLPGRSVGAGRLPALEGQVPPLGAVPSGCPFHPRCPAVVPGRCDRGDPPALQRDGAGHAAACVRLEPWPGSGEAAP